MGLKERGRSQPRCTNGLHQRERRSAHRKTGGLERKRKEEEAYPYTCSLCAAGEAALGQRRLHTKDEALQAGGGEETETFLRATLQHTRNETRGSLTVPTDISLGSMNVCCEGSSLLCTVPCSLTEALLGAWGSSNILQPTAPLPRGREGVGEVESPLPSAQAVWRPWLQPGHVIPHVTEM